MYIKSTCRKKIARHARRAVFLASVFMLFLGGAFAQQGQGVSVPLPDDTSLADTHTMRLGKLDIESKLYFSAQPLEQLVIFYKAFFAKEKFAPLIDTWEKPKRLLRYKKNDEVVSIALSPQGQKTQIVIARYLQPFGTPAPEESRPAWRDLVESLPNKDQGPSDLTIIPRPPESVRVGGGKMYNITMFFYTSGMPPQEINEFYKLKMPQIGWNLVQETDMGKTNQDFQRDYPHKKKPPSINLPFPDVTFEQLISGGRMLIFTGEWGEAELSMFNSLGKNQGTLVLIKLTEKNEKK